MNMFWNGYQYQYMQYPPYCFPSNYPYYPTNYPLYYYPAPQQTEVIGQLLKRISDLEAKLDKV